MNVRCHKGAYTDIEDVRDALRDLGIITESSTRSRFTVKTIKK